MKTASNDPFPAVVRWLADFARFPACRLAIPAETLLCFAAAAAAEEAQANERFLIKSRDAAQTSAARSHAIRRSQVHFKCDNSAKV